MRILQLCHKPPTPSVDGGCIAMLASAKALINAGCQVKTLAMETHKHPFLIDEAHQNIVAQTNMEAFFVNTEINIIPAFLNLFSSKSYNISRFYDTGFEQKLIETVSKQKFEVVLMESLFVAPYFEVIRKHAPKCKIILRAHNLEHIIWEKTAAESGLIKRPYLNLLASRLKKFELDVFQKMDGIIAISKDDAAKIKQFAPEKAITSIPVNVEVGPKSSISNNNVFFIGAFDWHPNVSGVNWFLKEVWPHINLENNLKFNLAGRKMNQHLETKPIHNVIYHGEVADAKDFMEQFCIMVVPLFAGSGIRVKILEAMALGKLVISTGLGAEGLGCIDGKEIIIANTAAEFISAIEKCSKNSSIVSEIGQNAANFVAENFSTQRLSEEFIGFLKAVQD
jgi:polysaccharide biosynthesis protein PslH